MDQRIKTEWVALLRYGNIKQTKRKLHNKEEGSFCCLGVLCEMAKQENIAEFLLKANDYRAKNNENDYGCGTLPNAVRKWAGLQGCNPTPNNSDKCLTYSNDTDGKTFSEIADIIEKGL